MASRIQGMRGQVPEGPKKPGLNRITCNSLSPPTPLVLSILLADRSLIETKHVLAVFALKLELRLSRFFSFLLKFDSHWHTLCIDRFALTSKATSL